MDTKKILAIIEAIAKRIEAEKNFLTELDNEIGDGDHGINLARGFKAVEEKLPTFADKDIGAILKGVGTALVSTVGGASGPLYGTAFMKAGNVCKGKMEITDADFVAALDAAINGVKMRGKAVEGEKTMLDALCPAYKAIKVGIDGGKNLIDALADGVDAAAKGVEYTKTIIATKGRASYLKERSLGHQDPGATSSLFMLQTTLEVLRGT
ncbi:MAG: dihydroxyacetone kinase subunit L [Selenomonadaceae bacterium]|nr:dihydroxyacetone kinase subunit L [Selenomonadaceae bacterium]MBQ6758813.1 dihydroxyacetone kinase subunit L [Selenomonadaceae bacterium]